LRKSVQKHVPLGLVLQSYGCRSGLFPSSDAEDLENGESSAGRPVHSPHIHRMNPLTPQCFGER